MGYAFAMSPALKRIYQDPTELGRALQRHLVLFNTTPHLSTFIFGLSIAMEEENQRNPEFNEESINAIKTSLMGPLAGIGDSIFWGSLKVIAAGMGIYFAQQGSLLGPILALLVYNLPHLLCRWYGLKLGYRAGTTWLMRIYQSGLMDRVTYIASIVGPHGRRRDDRQHDRYHHPAQLYRRADHHGRRRSLLTKYFLRCCRCLFTLGMYKLIRKGVNINWILLGTVAFGMAASALGPALRRGISPMHVEDYMNETPCLSARYADADAGRSLAGGKSANGARRHAYYPDRLRYLLSRRADRPLVYAAVVRATR